MRAQLVDLPPTEVSEILHDVSSTLDELDAESGPGPDAPTTPGAVGGEQARYAALVVRLGTPQAYAAELRAAAGYPSTPPAAAPDTPGQPERFAQVAVAALVFACGLVAVGGIGMVLGGGSVGAALLLTVVAGVVSLAALPALFGSAGGPRLPAIAALPVVGQFRGAAPDPATVPGKVAGFLASLQPAWWLLRALLAAGLLAGGNGSFVLFLALIAVPVSLWLGHRSRRDRRWVWVVAPLNVLAAFVLLAFLTAWDNDRSSSSYSASAPLSGLYLDGEQVRDIRPVDAQGTPLTGVYLFDESGRVLDTGDPTCDQIEAQEYGSASTAPQPYPRGTVDWTNGRCRQLPPPPLVVAVPTPPATPTPSDGSLPGPSGSAAPTPSAGVPSGDPASPTGAPAPGQGTPDQGGVPGAPAPGTTAVTPAPPPG